MIAKSIHPKKILIINIFGIGDVLFTTPLMRNLKLQYPGLYIGYVCNSRSAAVLQNNTKVDQLFIYDRDDFVSSEQQSRLSALKKTNRFIKTIKQEHFDTSLDVSLSQFTNWMTWAAGIKHRIGFKYKNRGLFLNHSFPLKGYEDKHVVEYYLSLLDQLGVDIADKNLELSVGQEDVDWAEHFFNDQNVRLNGQLPIGLVPGGGASWGKDAVYKRWSSKNYAKLADNLIEKFSAPIILMGDKSDYDLCEEVSGAMNHPSVMACGKTSIGQFAALAQKCALMIVNDGGPLHISVAVGTRTASIFGPVDSNVYGPYPQGNHIVINKNLACQPCYRRFRRASCDHISCLEQLSVDDVFEQVKEGL